MLTSMSTWRVWQLDESVQCTFLKKIKPKRKTHQSNGRKFMYWFVCIYRSEWNVVRYSFSLSLSFSFSIVPFHFNPCAYLSSLAGFAVIKGKSNQIGLRIVNGVTCTTRIAADVRWMRHDVFPVLCMQFHSFAGKIRVNATEKMDEHW